jgi:phosphomannomutase
LTGFKWIWNAALELEKAEGVRFRFGYEEALGYSAGRFVRDKDGVSAAYLFAELAARCRARGEGVLERLARLYRRYGVWASMERSFVRPGVEGARRIQLAVDRVAQDGPRQLAGARVENVVDFRRGAETRVPWLPNDAVVELTFEGKARVLVRPSGTEPKLKLYADVPEALGAGERVGAAEDRALDRARALLDAMAEYLDIA